MINDPPALFTEFAGYVVTIARRAGRGFPWLSDDFVSDSLLTLWKLSVNENLNVDGALHEKRLVAFAVNRAIADRIRRERSRNAAAFHRAGPMVNADGSETDAMAFIVDERGPEDTGAGFEALLAQIPDAQVRDLARRHFADDATFAELGRERGVSGSAINQRVRREVRKLATIVN